MATQTVIAENGMISNQELDQLVRERSNHSLPALAASTVELLAKHHDMAPAEAQAAGSGPYAGRLVVKSRGRVLSLPVSEIRWIGAEENYVRISTATESHLLRETMTSIERSLDPRCFQRIHRSSIVNLRYVKEVRSESRGDFAIYLINGQKLAMSRSYRARMSAHLSHPHLSHR